MSVSVVVPAFNAGRYLRTALSSVLQQSLEDFEIVVVDDGSSDDTSDIVSSVQRTDSRVRLIRTDNGGTMRARSIGIDHARYEFIATLDADDVMARDRLAKQVAYLSEHANVAALGTYIHYINSKGAVVGSFAPRVTDPIELRRLHEEGHTSALHHPSTMMRRSAVIHVGSYRPPFDVAEDFDLWTRLLDAGYEIAILRAHLTYYRVHRGSLSVDRAIRMAHLKRYAKACSRARRSGIPEPSLDDFEAEERTLPLALRVDRRRKDLAQALYSSAVRSYAAGEYMRFVMQFSGASALRPVKYVKSALMRWRRAPSGHGG